jgi:2,6-dihydroxypyridine 3-monooxygenase
MPGSSATTPRVVVIGGSLGGLNAAVWLRAAGCEVNVFERSPAPLQGRGAGIVLHPSTVRYFMAHGLADLEGLSVAARWFRYLDTAGHIVHEEASHYRFAAYGALYRHLLRDFGREHYHLGAECTGFVPAGSDGSGAIARFADGHEARCDLLVFADGINSVGRRLLLPGVEARYAGYVAWRGTVSAGSLSASTRETLRAAVTYVVLPDSHALSYPISDPEGTQEPGQRPINWLWYRNVARDTQLDELLTGRGGVHFGTSVPPGMVEDQHIQRLRQDAAATLPPPFQEMVRNTADPYVQVVVDLEVPRMAFGHACLIGDAAFVARPHAAAGTAKAAEDAWTLSNAVVASQGDVWAALSAWEVEQLALGHQVVLRSRQAGERLQGGAWRASEPLAFGLYRSGDSAFGESRHWLGR